MTPLHPRLLRVVAACAATPAHGLGLALATEAGAPEWAQLMPPGPHIAGRDGRSWKLSDPQRLLSAFAAHQGPVAIDWEHGQDLRAQKGEEAPAAGWIEQMELRDGALWGRVTWTPRAAAAVAAREYRFISPAFDYDPATREVAAVIGAGLVNRPNFVMAALNAQHHQEPPMRAILAALSLPDTASEAEALAALERLKAEKATALNAAQAAPSLDRYVPRADFDAMQARATAAEQAVSTREAAEREATIEREVDGAVAAGKIAPASKDYHLATCRAEGGLERFRTYIAGAASLFDPAKTPDPAKGPDKATALNAEQKDVARTLGIPEADFARHLAETAA